MTLQSVMIGALSFLASMLIFYTVGQVLLLDWLPNNIFISTIILSALIIAYFITRKSMSDPSTKTK
ncbi:hypothetical protein [Bacillus rhizoplanae]|uniref:hypothetical protein n=1 Tax=Bacillus rhizoplanae TaxID=2880966 RepID=UPI003D243D74